MKDALWTGKRVLVTGHTGFKGGWLSLWLQSLGADVAGFSLPPPTIPSLFEVAHVGEGMHSRIGDIRDPGVVRDAIQASAPEVVFHLAAQPLVRESYHDPVGTYATNVMGTVNVLEAVRHCPSVRAVVVITTDKCYENLEQRAAYAETDPLGGHDPYSNSKACAELVAAAYRRSFLAARGTAVATARAGNVIGGGDWSADRLVPDVLRAFGAGETLHLRYPHAVRPWQHVLEPLGGYLRLAEALLKEPDTFAEAWNFGPREADEKTVGELVATISRRWQDGDQTPRWTVDHAPQPHEAGQLRLDSAKAIRRLGWQPRWNLDTAIAHTLAWHRAWRAGNDMGAFTQRQILEYATTADSGQALP